MITARAAGSLPSLLCTVTVYSHFWCLLIALEQYQQRKVADVRTRRNQGLISCNQYDVITEKEYPGNV
jgi:hypothetical protein